MNLSRSFADAAMQSMLRAGVGDGLQQSSHPDAVALASAFAAAQANVSSVINYRTMSKIAETLLPTLRNAVEFVALAAFPIVIVLVMGAGIGGAVLLRGYVMIFAWLALWPPLYAVVNYLMVRVDGSPMSRLLTEYGGDTMVAAKLIQHMGATSQDMAGMLAILVPVIAFALVRGGDIAASSLVSGILGPASSAGQAQGSSLAQGNVSLGNVAWSSAAMNRVEGNSMNLVPSAAYGMGGSFQNAYGTHVTGLGGSVTAAAARPIDLGASVQMDHSAVARQASASAIVSNFARNVQATLTDGSTAGLGSQAVAEQTRAALEALNRQVGATHGSETYSGASSASGGGSATNVTEGSDVATGARAGLGGNASDRPITSGASGKGVPGKRAVPSWLQVLSAIGEAGVSIRADDVSRSARELQGFSRGEIQEGARELRNALEQIANTSSDQATRSGARRLMAGLDKTLSAMQSEGVGLTRTDSGSRTVSVELGGGSRMSFDLNGLVLQAAQREYGSLDKAMEAARTDPLGYQARMQQAMQGVMESLLQKISAQYAADLKTPEQIDKQVQQAVNDAASMFGKRVEERNTENQGKVAKKQADNGTPPGTPVRLDGHGAHSEVQELAEKNLQENAEQAAMMKGAASAVQQLMAQPKWERMWSAAKGMAGEAPQLVKPASALLDQASSDEGLRALLLKAGGGARLSDSELEQVAARLSASRR